MTTFSAHAAAKPRSKPGRPLVSLARVVEAQEQRQNWWGLGAVCGATFMLLVDITIVQVALPSIHDDLGASFTQLQWVIDAYALSLASLLLTYGTLADRFGRKRIFDVGVAIFTLASLLCGISQSGLQ